MPLVVRSDRRTGPLQSLWSTVKRAIFGRPVTHAEQQAARTRQTRNPYSDAAMSMHSARFNGLGNSR